VKGDRSNAGVDIVAGKRAARQQIRATEIAAAAPTFEQCAERYIDEHWSGWSEKHRAQWPSSLKRYAYATIGNLTIADIKRSRRAAVDRERHRAGIACCRRELNRETVRVRCNRLAGCQRVGGDPPAAIVSAACLRRRAGIACLGPTACRLTVRWRQMEE
jgi:hypothetical protein